MIKNIDWEKAINIRRSIRSYKTRSVEESKINLIKNFINKMEVPFKHNVKVRLFEANTDRKLYGAFTAPPDGIAFLSNTDNCSISKAGFIGEIVILYATSLGLATCWYGHYSLAELEHIMPHLGIYAEQPQPKWGYGKDIVEGERAICITPLGYWKKDGLRVIDRIQQAFISYKRKPIDAFLEGDIKEEDIPSEIMYAIDLARKAPSALNSQPWRFSFSPDLRTISIAMPVEYKHFKWEYPNVDIGICASHFWLGLIMKNVECDVSLKEEQGRVIWNFNVK